MSAAQAESLGLVPTLDFTVEGVLATNAVDHLEAVVRTWHDRTHRDGWQLCREQPCHAFNLALEDVTA